MATGPTLPTTQRAYTLRLRGISENDTSWRDALWATHDAVNRGAKVFGDWILTLRGGLCETLVDEPVKVATSERPPTESERRDRRILLALSWLSVEDAHGAPNDASLIVASGTESADCRARKLTDTLTAILTSRRVAAPMIGDPAERPEAQPGTWLGDCMPSLAAAIREDAVWVNRSAAFDACACHTLPVVRDDIWDFLEPFFGSAQSYLHAANSDSEENLDDGSNKDEKAKDLVQKAGGWLSRRMGTGGGADFHRISRGYDAIAEWARAAVVGNAGDESLTELAHQLSREGFSPLSRDCNGVLSVISGPGYKSATRNHVAAMNERPVVSKDDLTKLAELATADAKASRANIGGKGCRAYATRIMQEVEAICGFTYRIDEAGGEVRAAEYERYGKDYPWGTARHCEFSVMLDHAARRANVAHSWIKNAEAERRQFEKDAQRLVDVPAEALRWLRSYCDERARSSGSLDEYRIRRRAIDGLDKVVTRWSRADCRTVDDRISAARQLQDDPEIDKFGDIQLFEALAAEDATCVWKPNGIPTAQPLSNFVAATEAAAKKRRFKVPAYRHPDSLRHPIFVDFGNSRWSVEFSAHRAANELGEMQEKVQKLNVALVDAERKLSNASAKQRESRESAVADCRQKLLDAERDLEAMRDDRRLDLAVWNGQAIAVAPFHWSGKRLAADLSLRPSLANSSKGRAHVSRDDRLGRAAAGTVPGIAVNIVGLFEQKNWNGRLQAPRRQFDAIARHVEQHGWDEKARGLIGRIRWLLTFSAELTQSGPWMQYCERFANDAPDKPFVSRTGEYAVKRASNQRSGHAKLALARLPGLRVLAVDLGHRYAAACAVWETITQKQLRQVCMAANVSEPNGSAMYLHLKTTNCSGKPITTVYRRIGSDTLSGSTPHPAPWARLDRQFLIKLQGEYRPARKASRAEIDAVRGFETWAGRVACDLDAPRELGVDVLMRDVVRTARLALGRHGRRARIAYQFVANERMLPGNRREALDAKGRVEQLIDTLHDWYSLASDTRWDDAPALFLWNERLSGLAGGFSIAPPPQSSRGEEEQSRIERQNFERVLRERLQPLAELLSGDETLRRELHDAWRTRWMTEDGQWRHKLHWLSRWLMPRNLSRVVEIFKADGTRVKRRRKIRDAVASASNVGGLSLMRIGTLTEFRRKVQVGYFTRLTPDGSRAEIQLRFGQSTLDCIEQLKEQRIKQLASRIVEGALGVGIERSCDRDIPRPQDRVNEARFTPCHAVVIEDLSHYRPEETRTRRENRATMDWKSAETRKRLADHCQLYGLCLRDVNPQYTSRQDSRTGGPGARCLDVSVSDFLCSPRWRKQIARAQEKAQKNSGDARDRYLLALDEKWSKAPQRDIATAKPLRIPVSGGELFVSAESSSPLAEGIQADLNAAANIGLRALTDADFEGRWWYVPATLSDDGYRIPNPEKCSGATCLHGWKIAKGKSGYSPDGNPHQFADEQAIKSAQAELDTADGALAAANAELKRAKKAAGVGTLGEATRCVELVKAAKKAAKGRLAEIKKAAKAKLYMNLWRDPSAASLSSGTWFEYGEYERKVQFRVIQVLRKRAGLPTEGANDPLPAN